MSDPAIDAARRATETGLFVGAYQGAVEGAREALAPLRARHYRGGRCYCCRWASADGTAVIARHLCAGCGQHWPCEDARLIYSDEELTDA